MIEAKVIEKTELTDRICRLILAAKNGQTLPAYEPGAHIDVYLGNGLIRQYSLCAPRHSPDYEIAVLKESKGRGGSLWIHEQLRVGDLLQISEPKNHFPLDPSAPRNLLFAAGIGVTPILAMAEHLAAQQQPFDLYYCARCEKEAIYLERIRHSLPDQAVHIHFTHGDAGKRLVADPLLVNADHKAHIYVCGPQSFMDAVLDSARGRDWPEAFLHREYFSIADGTTTKADHSFEIEIHSTGQVLTVPEEQSIVQVLEAHDIFIPVACEEGVCGTCLTGLLAGQADHRDVFLTDAEKQKMDQFTPCCSRAKSRRLVLDL
jgi:vanillate O-demethylase ferredoxin subunit